MILEPFLTSTAVVAIGEIADLPAVLRGEAATKIVPLHIGRLVAAVIFVLIGVWVLLSVFHFA